jgi:glycine/D-amino acid oxidase-like deaminating enzyme
METVIVGGGQAGLALSYYLGHLGREHVVLERGRVAERWRRIGHEAGGAGFRKRLAFAHARFTFRLRPCAPRTLSRRASSSRSSKHREVQHFGLKRQRARLRAARWTPRSRPRQLHAGIDEGDAILRESQLLSPVLREEFFVEHLEIDPAGVFPVLWNARVADIERPSMVSWLMSESAHDPRPRPLKLPQLSVR